MGDGCHMINLFERPKLKIKTTKSEWIWNIIGYSFYLGSLILLVINWNKLPEEVPAHYNGLGEVTRWGSKGVYFIIPIIMGIFLLLMMQTLERFPEVYNYPKRLNESNAKKFYLVTRKMMNQFKNIFSVTFSYLLIQKIAIAFNWNDGLGMLFLPIAVIGLGIPIVIGIVSYKRIK